MLTDIPLALISSHTLNMLPGAECRAERETRVPFPRTICRIPSSTSAWTAVRTVVRLMPYCSCKRLSLGMNSPFLYSPVMIFSRRSSMIF